MAEISLSGDGGRYAVSTDLSDYPEGVRRLCPEDAKVLLRVHDIVSGRTLFAIPSVIDVARIALDRAGGRLAAVGADGSLTVYRLP